MAAARLTRSPARPSLDMAGGTGDMARASPGWRRAARRRGGRRRRVLVVDFNAETLRRWTRARRRSGDRLGRRRRRGLALPDASADAGCIAFGLRNVTGIEGRLAEAHRALQALPRFSPRVSRLVTGPCSGAYDVYSVPAHPCDRRERRRRPGAISTVEASAASRPGRAGRPDGRGRLRARRLDQFHRRDRRPASRLGNVGSAGELSSFGRLVGAAWALIPAHALLPSRSTLSPPRPGRRRIPLRLLRGPRAAQGRPGHAWPWRWKIWARPRSSSVSCCPPAPTSSGRRSPRICRV